MKYEFAILRGVNTQLATMIWQGYWNDTSRKMLFSETVRAGKVDLLGIMFQGCG